ncbi:MAG TPA: hypothetical protein VET85_16125 [Stellaceae bacterium]|nr:hypothetical protein [Stellaceae bacterium]
MGDCRREPPLSQMLEDPMTRAVMLSDRVDVSELRLLLSAARERIAEADRGGAGHRLFSPTTL